MHHLEHKLSTNTKTHVDYRLSVVFEIIQIGQHVVEFKKPGCNGSQYSWTTIYIASKCSLRFHLFVFSFERITNHSQQRQDIPRRDLVYDAITSSFCCSSSIADTAVEQMRQCAHRPSHDLVVHSVFGSRVDRAVVLWVTD